MIVTVKLITDIRYASSCLIVKILSMLGEKSVSVCTRARGDYLKQECCSYWGQSLAFKNFCKEILFRATIFGKLNKSACQWGKYVQKTVKDQ